MIRLEGVSEKGSEEGGFNWLKTMSIASFIVGFLEFCYQRFS
jgi:hypothetical protein